MKLINKLLTCLLAVTAILTGPVTLADVPQSREWSFKVSLNDKPVGTQHFRLLQENGTTRLETEADLAVKMLFVTVYRYLHNNVETWDGECLTAIKSSTRVNGKRLSVSGERQDGYFAVEGSSEPLRLPECIMSFAYWNPTFLNESQLLNSQSGEYLPVEISGPIADERTVRGETLTANRYRLVANDIDMLLWYSPDNTWLGLESKTRGGHLLRYELM